MADRPGLGTLLDAHSDQATAKMRGPMPGKVLSYDRATQCAEVQPIVSPKGQTLPVLPRVPVLFPRGLLGGYSIVWDLHEMDEVRETPIVAMSTPAVLERYVPHLQVDGVLSKPITLQTLEACLSRFKN